MKNLKTLRLSKNLSQQQLALRLDLSQQTIYKYENQITEPDIATLIKLADYFNTSVDYLIGNTDNYSILKCIVIYQIIFSLPLTI